MAVRMNDARFRKAVRVAAFRGVVVATNMIRNEVIRLHGTGKRSGFFYFY